MLVRFTKDCYKPERQKGNAFIAYGGSPYIDYDYRAGKVHDLPELLARYHISKGEAVQVAKISLVKKPTPQTANVFKALRLKPQPSDRISIPTLTPKEIEAIKSRETSEAFKEVFKDPSYSNIPVKEIVDLLLGIYDYAISTNDNNIIIRVSRDLTTILKLVRLVREKKKDGGSNGR